MPAVIAPKRFQAHQAFIPHATPELTGPFEPALVLSAGRFHGTAALGLSGPPRGGIVHAPLMVLEVVELFLHRLTFVSAQAFGQLLQVV